jgi:hypothetical protein
MLAYYVEWHLRKAWEGLTFTDTELAEAKKTGDPVVPARKTFEPKKQDEAQDSEESPDKPMKFGNIIQNLSVINEVKLVVRQNGLFPEDILFDRRKKLTPLQDKALKLTRTINV